MEERTYNPKSHAGKTARSRAKQARNEGNKQARAAWGKLRGATNSDFPKETCNGKRYR